MDMKTDPKSLKLTKEQMDWLIGMVWTNPDDDHGNWIYDRVVRKYWVGNEELRIQIDISIENGEFEVHTW